MFVVLQLFESIDDRTWQWDKLSYSRAGRVCGKAQQLQCGGRSSPALVKRGPGKIIGFVDMFSIFTFMSLLVMVPSTSLIINLSVELKRKTEKWNKIFSSGHTYLENWNYEIQSYKYFTNFLFWKNLENVVVANHPPCTILSWSQIELPQVFVAELIVTRRIFKTELSGVADCHPYSRRHTVHKNTHLVMLTNMRTLLICWCWLPPCLPSRWTLSWTCLSGRTKALRTTCHQNWKYVYCFKSEPLCIQQDFGQG